MNKKEWGDIFFLLKETVKREAGRVKSLVVLSAAEAILPYISIVGMGKLLDEIYGGAEGRILFSYVLIILLGTFACKVILERASARYWQKMDYTKDLEAKEMNGKSLSMDYEYLEEPHVQGLRSRAFSKSFFGIRGWALWLFHDLLKSVFSFFLTLCLFLPMLAQKGKSENGYGFSMIFAGLCLMIAVMEIGSYKASVYYGRKTIDIYNTMDGLYNKKRYFAEMLSGVESQKDLRINCQQEEIDKEMEGICSRLLEKEQMRSRIFIKRKTIDILTSESACFLIYFFICLWAFMGLISIGSVVVYAAAMVQLTGSVCYFSGTMGNVKQLAMFAGDYAEYMSLGKRKYMGTIPVEKRRDNRFHVSFEHVSFRYPGTEKDVIQDLTLSFEIGEKMAIVGKNGSGKTTFIKLLCRLYDVTEGVIKVNGIDIRKYDYQEYCRLFAVVFQDFSIFSFSLLENIAASEEADEALAKAALEKAGLSLRLAELPKGLKTYVGKEYREEGIAFSGGEKQKMAIARAIYKNAPFVIMDEPTAALDPLAECEVYAGFDKMVGAKTALYISHRLASCRFCEDILVFENGRVVQRGSHEQLKEQEGVYRKLWNAQAKYYEN